jgi:hypothetical protein
MANSHTISVTVAAAPASVYEYASDPRNLPKWAPGFVQSITPRDGKWIAKTPLGEVTFTFANRNDLGVLDHDVTLPTGEVFKNPMRVVPNEGGSEVLFTLFQIPPMSDEQFEQDAKTVLADLTTLKTAVEALK